MKNTFNNCSSKDKKIIFIVMSIIVIGILFNFIFPKLNSVEIINNSPNNATAIFIQALADKDIEKFNYISRSNKFDFFSECNKYQLTSFSFTEISKDEYKNYLKSKNQKFISEKDRHWVRVDLIDSENDLVVQLIKIGDKFYFEKLV